MSSLLAIQYYDLKVIFAKAGELLKYVDAFPNGLNVKCGDISPSTNRGMIAGIEDIADATGAAILIERARLDYGVDISAGVDCDGPVCFWKQPDFAPGAGGRMQIHASTRSAAILRAVVYLAGKKSGAPYPSDVREVARRG